MAGLSDRYKNKSSKQEERKKKERTTAQGTKEPGYSKKELGNLMNNRDHNRKVKDNSEDKIRYITSDFKNRRLQILQDPTNSAPRKQSSKEEHGHD